jgi:bifunctional non-homologous end joining protein LigD
VVQRHRARRLHYDFRLEMDGVLASWAVPKGPTLDPGVKRLAVHVEDHPVEYFDFEGVIPEGEYGGGDVIVWDWGTWEPADDQDPVEAVDRGDLHIDIHGTKLAGRFALVRRGKRGGKEQWLLIHKRDDAASEGWDAEEYPTSVKSGRTNDEVAADPDAAWDSGAEPATARRPLKAEAAPRWPAPDPEELARLDELGMKGTWNFDGVDLAVTNLDKELFAGRGKEGPVTKRDLIRYHAYIAPHMLPYLVSRPVNLHRYPNGAAAKGFWAKSVPTNAPAWLTRGDVVEESGEVKTYLVPDRPAALAYVANLAALEVHPWTSRIEDVHEPTWAMVDIDPGPATAWDDAVVLARLYRTALDHLGVQGRPKVTGKRGIQIWIPVRPGLTFDDTAGWVEALSRAVGSTVPELVSWRWQKAERGGKARLDYTQNAVNKTLVAPFSARPAPGAPVSVPIEWDELDDPQLRPDRWTIRTVLDRIAESGDPLLPLIGLPQDLPPLT